MELQTTYVKKERALRLEGRRLYCKKCAIAHERLSRAADIETDIGWDNSSQFNTNVMRVTDAEIALLKGDTQAAGEEARLRLRELPDDKRMYQEGYELRLLLVEGQALLLHRNAQNALSLLQRAVLLAARVYDPNVSPRFAAADIALARCYVILGDLSAARKLLAQATAIHATHPRLGEHYRQTLQLATALFNRARSSPQ